MPTSSFRRLTLQFLTLLLSFIACGQPAARAQDAAQSQPKEQTPKQQVFCDRARAVALVEAQLSEAKMFADPVKRIAVMTHAADLLWPFEPQTAHDTFADAFDLAVKDFRDQGSEPKKQNGMAAPKVDRRFAVMSAIARRDPAWARTLAEGVAEEKKRAAEEAANATNAASDNADGERGRSSIAENTLGLAQSLLPVDRGSALALARGTFRYPASYTLMLFLFKLAETDQAAADALYREALGAYADRTAGDLVYLSVYPFALNREPAIVPVRIYYATPPNFSPAPQLREMFLEVLFRQVETKFKMPEVAPAEGADANTEQAQLLTTLTLLEPQIARLTPSLLERALALKGDASAAASAQSRSRAEGFADFTRDNDEEGLFDRSAEKAERETNPAKHDYFIATMVNSARGDEEFRRAEKSLEEVSDSSLRDKLASYLYFRWTQQAVSDGKLNDATRLSRKVDELDYRALLSFQIAEAALKRLNDHARAIELLESVAADALKAPDTPEKARALLGVAHLYANFDAVRAADVLRAAVKVVNLLPNQDFDSDRIGRQLGNDFFQMYAMYKTPGIRLENVFRELGARDFESALSAANGLDDKNLRAAALLSVAEKCLEDSRKPEKPKSERPKPAKATPAADARKGTE
jgi:hypothetical protein